MAHYNLGIAFFMTGQFNKAENAFIKAIGINPRLNKAWSGLGDLYFHNRQLEKARISYLKSLEIDPMDGKIHNNLAVTYYYEKKFPKALQHVKEAEKLGFPVNEEFKKELKKSLGEK